MLKILKSGLVKPIDKLDNDSIHGAKELIFAGFEKPLLDDVLKDFEWLYRPFGEYKLDHFSHYKIWCVNDKAVEDGNEKPVFNLCRLVDVEMDGIRGQIKSSFLYLEYINEIYDCFDAILPGEYENYFDAVLPGTYQDYIGPYVYRDDNDALIGTFENDRIIAEYYIVAMNVHDEDDVEHMLFIHEKSAVEREYQSYYAYRKERNIKDKIKDLGVVPKFVNAVHKCMDKLYEDMFLGPECIEIKFVIHGSADKFADDIKEYRKDYASLETTALVGDIRLKPVEFDMGQYQLALTIDLLEECDYDHKTYTFVAYVPDGICEQ